MSLHCTQLGGSRERCILHACRLVYPNLDAAMYRASLPFEGTASVCQMLQLAFSFMSFFAVAVNQRSSEL